ncbi:MAG: hypothetical protein MUF07_09975 [Steroidobacteraceae bacterium]|nr:hypothetical protein [Steroidobacteraceae bacterium]
MKKVVAVDWPTLLLPVRFGTLNTICLVSTICRRSMSVGSIAVTETGTVWMFSSRRWALTVTSSRTMLSAGCCACATPIRAEATAAETARLSPFGRKVWRESDMAEPPVLSR